MTNRDEFNQYIRNLLNEQIEYFENLSDEELVDLTTENPNAGISLAVGRKLCYFKATKAGLPVGTKDDVKSWLGKEERIKGTEYELS